MDRQPIRLPPRCAESFRLGDCIAVGGFGAVYRGTQIRFDRPVALKLLRPDLVTRPDAIDRFRAEARITAALNHPHIVKVLDADVEEDVPWIAYELVNGPTLRERLNAGRVPWPQAARLASQIASALAAAHAHDVLHRDVKPENVLEAPAGFARVTDFGIARWHGSNVHTQEGLLIGTPTYLAPEVALGQRATAAADIYAVGVLLYELLVGRRPFHAYNVAGMLDAHIKSPVPAIDGRTLEIPGPLCMLVARLLAKAPGDRPASAEQLAAELDVLLAPVDDVTGAVLYAPPRAPEPEPVVEPPPPPRAPATPPAQHRTAALAVVVALAVVTSFILVRFAVPPAPPPIPAPPPRAPALSAERVAAAFAELDRQEKEHRRHQEGYEMVHALTMSTTRPAHEDASKLARDQARSIRQRTETLDRLEKELGPPPPEPGENVAARVMRADLAMTRAFLALRLDRVQQRARMADRSLVENLDTVGDIARLMTLEMTIQYDATSLPPLLAAFAALARAAPHLAAGASAPPEAGPLFEHVLRLGDQFNPYHFRAPVHADYLDALSQWERNLDRNDPPRGFRPGRLVADLYLLGATGTAKRLPVGYARALDGLEHARRALPNAAAGLERTEAEVRRYGGTEKR